MIEIRITVQGEQRLRQALADLARSIQDYSPAWEVITRNFQRAMRGQFGSQGARGGKTWAPLSRAYSRWKERVAPGRPILVLTGDLVLSLIRQTGDTIHEERPLSLTLGTKVPYAKYHQTGSKKNKRLPARPPLVLTDQDYRDMSTNLTSYSAEFALNAGFQMTNYRAGKMRLGRKRGR